MASINKIFSFFLIVSLGLTAPLLAPPTNDDPFKNVIPAIINATVGTVVFLAIAKVESLIEYYATTTPEEREAEKERKKLRPELLRMELEKRNLELQHDLLRLKGKLGALEEAKVDFSTTGRNLAMKPITLADLDKSGTSSALGKEKLP